MSLRGTLGVTDGSEPGQCALVLAPAGQRGAARDLAERAERLWADVTRGPELPDAIGRVLAGHGRKVARARFQEVSPSDLSLCSADLFSSFPDSFHRRAL